MEKGPAALLIARRQAQMAHWDVPDHIAAVTQTSTTRAGFGRPYETTTAARELAGTLMRNRVLIALRGSYAERRWHQQSRLDEFRSFRTQDKTLICPQRSAAEVPSRPRGA